MPRTEPRRAKVHVRVTEELRERLERVARDRRWSVSQTVSVAAEHGLEELEDDREDG